MNQLVNIFPNMTLPYAVDDGRTDAIFSAQTRRRHCMFSCSNFLYLHLSQFGAGVYLALCSLLAALSHLVIAIAFICTKKQVVRAYTSRNIAFMAYKHPVRNGAEVKFPREAMGSDRRSRSFPVFDVAISIWAQHGSPQPAGIGLVDLLPKAHFYRDTACMSENKAAGNLRFVFGFLKWLAAATSTKALFFFRIAPSFLQDQVSWIYAKQITAKQMVTTNGCAVRNRAVLEFPRNARCFFGVPLYPDMPDAITVSRPSPQPAPIIRILIDLLPEPFRKRAAKMVSLFILRNIVRVSCIERRATTALTEANKRGRINLHSESPIQIWGAVLPAVSAARGLLAAHYNTKEQAA